jgi:hypothetical protein
MKFIKKNIKIIKMSKQRCLTEYEIESILSFITPQKCIPTETSESVVTTNKNRLRHQLIGQLIYPEMIPQLKNMIEKQYNDSIVQPGESVGVISAQSIGEKQTQTTLNTFHHAGAGDKTVTTGVPRVEELLNATKDPRSVTCIVYTKKNHDSLAELRKTIGSEVVEITFSKITKEYKIEMNKKPEPWYEAFKILHGDAFTQYTDCISLKLDVDILYEYKLDMEMIAEIISKDYSDMICVFSPDNISQLDVFVDTSNIDLPDNRLSFIDSDNAKEIYLEEVVQPILYKIIISGIPGIENIYFNDNPNNFETYGTNYKKLLGLPFVDYTKTISNDVWDIYNTLGVEAAREFLIEEFMQLCAGINKCHIQLLAEKMTYTGGISSISRYTMRNEDCGPMGKASFEETMDNFLKAGAYGQNEATRGVSASIICGKRANIGTGVCELMMNIKSLPCIVNDKISEFSHVIKTKKVEHTDIKILETKLEKRLEKKRAKPIVLDSESDSESDEEVVQLTEKDFENCKYTAKVYFGTVDQNMADTNEDGYIDDEGLTLSFDSKEPIDVTMQWKDGIKIGKEIFSGFNSTHGVYTLLDGIDISEQGRFMRIIGKPIKVEKESVKVKKSTNKNSEKNDDPKESVKVKKNDETPIKSVKVKKSTNKDSVNKDSVNKDETPTKSVKVKKSDQAPTVIYQRGKDVSKRFGIVVRDKTLYIMRGKFQSKMQHCAPDFDEPLKKILKNNKNGDDIKARFSISFRYSGDKQEKCDCDGPIPTIWSSDEISLDVKENALVDISFDDVLELVKDDLNPDITKIAGKVHLNKGRTTVTYSTIGIENYKYGGKTINIKKMPKQISKLLKKVSEVAGVMFNWVHIVHYPDGHCKLDWHSDDENIICKNSDIAGFSLFKNVDDIRTVEFRPKPDKQKKEKVAEQIEYLDF